MGTVVDVEVDKIENNGVDQSAVSKQGRYAARQFLALQILIQAEREQGQDGGQKTENKQRNVVLNADSSIGNDNKRIAETDDCGYKRYKQIEVLETLDLHGNYFWLMRLKNSVRRLGSVAKVPK